MIGSLSMSIRSWWWRKEHPAEAVGKERLVNMVPRSAGQKLITWVWCQHMLDVNEAARLVRRRRPITP